MLLIRKVKKGGQYEMLMRMQRNWISYTAGGSDCKMVQGLGK